MKRLQSRGFSGVEAVIIILVVVAVAALGWRLIAARKNTTSATNSTNNVRKSQKSVSSTQPKLKNLGGVTLAPYDTVTKMAGDIEFSKYYVNSDHNMTTASIFFGQQVPSHADHTKTLANPNFTFAGLKTAIDVVSPIDGKVIEVKQQPETKDYEVMLWEKEDSIYVLGLDHLTDVTVKRGDSVAAEQVLGKAARENNGSYRYELQINKEENGQTSFACPTQLLAADVKQKWSDQLDLFANDWNIWWGSAAYPQMTGGCVKQVLTLNEVEQ